MYDRLSDKNIIPSMEQVIAHISACKELFEDIDLFITNELDAEKKLGFSSDKNVRGWGIGLKSKSKFFGTVIAEKDAFTVVMRLTDDQIKKAYAEALPYSQKCLDNCHRTSNGGWVQYRVATLEQLDEVKKILIIRNK